MSAARPRRRLLRNVAIAPMAAVLSACVGLREIPARTIYVLRDLGESAQLLDAPSERALLISSSADSAFYDGTGLVYRREPGALAYYQFAGWSERPATRIGQLLQRRLAQTRAFRDVAATTASVHGEWLLEVQLEELIHDDASPPGLARIAVFARLIDRDRRRTIATQRFEHSEALESESAEQAVRALDRALTRLLDDAVRWVLKQRDAPLR